MRVQGNLVVLRPVRSDDISAMQAWDNDPEVIRLVGKKFITPNNSLDWFKAVNRKAIKFAMAITTHGGDLIGSIEIDDISWRARSGELRVCIGEREYWGKGYGTDALRAFLDFVFDTLRIDYIYLRVYRSNQRAVNCYKKCGFKVEGLLRAGSRQNLGFEDLILMGYRRNADEMAKALD